jgi:hypothetical protein
MMFVELVILNIFIFKVSSNDHSCESYWFLKFALKNLFNCMASSELYL